MSYTFNQASADLYNLLDSNGHFTIDRSHAPVFSVIPREVPYDPHSLLQVTESAYTHTPRIALRPVEPLPLLLPESKQSYEPFLFPSPYEDQEMNTFMRKMRLDDLYASVAAMDMSFNPLLWSRFLTLDQIVREQGAPPIFRAIRYNFDFSNKGYRFAELFYAIETICNYSPRYASYQNVLTQDVTNRQMLDTLLRLLGIEKKLGGFMAADAYRTILIDEEGLLNSPERPLAILRIGQKMRQYIANPQNFQLFSGSRGVTLLTWLLLPHPTPEEMTPDMDYVLYALACMVRLGRFPTETEYATRAYAQMNGSGVGNVSSTGNISANAATSGSAQIADTSSTPVSKYPSTPYETQQPDYTYYNVASDSLKTISKIATAAGYPYIGAGALVGQALVNGLKGVAGYLANLGLHAAADTYNSHASSVQQAIDSGTGIVEATEEGHNLIAGTLNTFQELDQTDVGASTSLDNNEQPITKHTLNFLTQLQIYAGIETEETALAVAQENERFGTERARIEQKYKNVPFFGRDYGDVAQRGAYWNERNTNTDLHNSVFAQIDKRRQEILNSRK